MQLIDNLIPGRFERSVTRTQRKIDRKNKTLEDIETGKARHPDKGFISLLITCGVLATIPGLDSDIGLSALGATLFLETLRQIVLNETKNVRADKLRKEIDKLATKLLV